ncbi:MULTISPECIES: SDR family oxidoreductase [unclassified Mycolicibacterium]|uniref:SDR family oxidoreductase n=1 Tax=unclassified Mycolicibacterium TaxID=2636767 RepID=UPI0012DE7E17|nr:MULTISPECIES: NAD(P)H-binding protein [unclassified Mycolicibacterium]MUL82465.1 NAD(P)H-binding protein [Mycolicibacterium sp. CBMA 329]MUL91403.1 NAD(P)H-binding protein [Mycolicibacterium sp. CBMA 331]MUM01526.1 NAD(P)H-binding protein [Mycolicibacterium sp. CBMA 334]MUM29401.1 NAD(P)H-binding protein [Mycolicibacterium sp. CBMA 295]MUM41827.1 NAD(P)H-binding protein [Mycolicibacterium sp. CBMA 247]
MTVLVTGATGNIGRRVVDHLITLGGHDIRALTTNPAKAALPASVTAITGYLGKPETLRAALEGVECVYLAPFPATVGPTLELMVQAGVQYVVALSGGAHWAEHADAVTASGLAHTQLGPGEFCENFAMWAPQIKTGMVRDVNPEYVQSPVSMDDIARVAAHLLTAPPEAHLGAMYDLTGPVALSRADIARQIGAGIGTPVDMQRCSRAEAEELLRPVMGDGAHWYLDLFEGDLEHQAANDNVERLTGTPAESMAQWAARNRGLFS